MPDNVQVYAEVFVNDEVAHCAHFLPGNFGVALHDLIWDPTRCFSNDLQVANDRVNGLLISLEFAERYGPCVVCDMLDAFQNIADADLPVPSTTLLD